MCFSKEFVDKTEETPLEYSKRILEGIRLKADKNKKLSTFLILVVLISTVFCPILILISQNDLTSKYIPAFLSAFAALSSYWIQLRKPQERWVLYRTAQREIEYEIDQFNHTLGNYSEFDKEKKLADSVSKRALKLHFEWIPMVPKAEEIIKIPNKDEEK